MTETTARLRPLTSRYSKPSPSASTTVRRCLFLSPIPDLISRPPGKFVSESKFKHDPATFIPPIQRGDAAALAALITKPEVERRLLIRLRKKAMVYAQDIANDGEPLPNGTGRSKIDVDCVVDLYESYIIPLTKDVEVTWSYGIPGSTSDVVLG